MKRLLLGITGILVALALMSCSKEPSICDSNIFDASQVDPTRYVWAHPRGPYEKVNIVVSTIDEIKNVCGKTKIACIYTISSTEANLYIEKTVTGDLLLHESLHAIGWIHPNQK